MSAASADYTFTVFTPTCNRCATLPRVYASLATQTFRDFEWLIVDDGSTDCTAALVEKWTAQADFPIRYLRQENRGKHIASNRAVREARGELFLVLDSDDACVPQALERFAYHWNSIPPEEKSSFSAVTALCADQHGRLVGDRFPHDVMDSDSLEIRYRYRVRGEKWGFHRTGTLRETPFPERIEGSYVPEGLVWNQIARRFKTRFVNETLRTYWIEGPSMVHGQDPGRNAPGGRLEHLAALNTELEWFRFAPGRFLASAVHYSRFAFHTGRGVRGQWRNLSRPLGRALWVLGLPLGFTLYRADTNRSWKILREQPYRFRFLVSRLLMKSGLSRVIVIRQPGFSLRFFPTALSASLWIHPEDHSGDLDFFRRYLRPGDVVVDVGANIGQLALGAATIVGDSGKVYAFEAHPKVARFLKKNVALNQAHQIEVFQLAIGDQNKAVRISNKSADDQNEIVGQGPGLCVEQQRLDDVAIGEPEIALLKIDVEGYEKFVLLGADRLLRRTRAVYFESWEEHFKRFGYRSGEVRDCLVGHGFQLFKVRGGEWLEVIGGEHRSTACENLLGVRDPEDFARRTGYRFG